jgi:hypothetical protein
MACHEFLIESVKGPGLAEAGIVRLEDGKIRVTASSWHDAKVIMANQALEVAIIGKQVGLVQVDSPALT